jgi:hypothetical protein
MPISDGFEEMNDYFSGMNEEICDILIKRKNNKNEEIEYEYEYDENVYDGIDIPDVE